MSLVLRHFINGLPAWLNNQAMLIALIIGYLIRSGKLPALQKALGLQKLSGLVKTKGQV